MERMTMSGLLDPSTQKIPEKLIILNDRIAGLTARMYNIKKKYENPKAKPSFLTERNMEVCIKHLTKKFPQFDVRSSGALLNSVNFVKDQILTTLDLDYGTFVDVLELRDHVNELLTTISACQVKFNLSLNFDLTYYYLNLISDFVCLMILISKIEQRKVILGLYSTAYEIKNGEGEQNFPRLGQMIMDYGNPLKKLSDDFSPHRANLMRAINSIAFIYGRRNLTADKWREAQLLSLVSTPSNLLSSAETDTIPCEYLSLETMNRWIIVSLSICHYCIAQPLFADLWGQALKSGVRFPIYRDEYLSIHHYLQPFLEGIKGYGKRVNELKELYTAATQNAVLVHRERRKFLRSALKQLWLLLSDEPGLIAPKLLLVLIGVSFSRDEVNWLLRHGENWMDKSASKTKCPVDISDKQLPELLFYIMELRNLVLKHENIIRCYYLQYLKGFDAPLLANLVKNAVWISDTERSLVNSITDTLANISMDIANPGSREYDFAALRLDLCRLQVYSESKGISLENNPDFAHAINTTIFHLKAVDELDQIMKDNSDLSLNCFYPSQLMNNFRFCLRVPSQARFVCVFPRICADFTHCFHNMCPEERIIIGNRATNTCDLFLKQTVMKAAELFAEICRYMGAIADQSLPENCRNEKQSDEKKSIGEKSKKEAKAKLPETENRPGDESYRKTIEDTNA
ncbi:unnamed protein product [Soboliphyme baturini]|uniref:Membrane-associated protein Hem n=1 Tax=Soboliphyme baturini TaxID=241478 RepID=A0A183IT94_9BILA|nr:unnamed protein product [Soboliphyme baturini]